MFESTTCLVVSSPQLDRTAAARLVLAIENNNGTAFLKSDFDTSQNWLQNHRITHIVSHSVDFIEYDDAKHAMIPVAAPAWVDDSVAAGRLLSPKSYSPDRRLFLKRCFVCISDEIPVSDKEVIYGGVRAFGGEYLDDLTKYTTHLVTTNLQNDKSLVALSADIDIKIVRPAWIDECFKMGRKLDEAPYLLDGAKPAPSSPVVPDSSVPEVAEFDFEFFSGKKFFLSADYHLGAALRESIVTLITKCGGSVVPRFDSSIDVYIGKYRQGREFSKSFRSPRIIIANLQWLYSVVVDKKWVLPTNSQLLHYPIPFKPLPQFQNLKISITNYSGDARYYLSKLIVILGGTFTKTLTKENHYLIVASPKGKKYETAAKKWTKNGQPFIKLVNHLWLEECFAKWELLGDAESRFKNFSGCERLLGRTKLNKDVLKNWNESDVDDSMNEDAGLLRATQDQTDYSEDENGANQLLNLSESVATPPALAESAVVEPAAESMIVEQEIAPADEPEEEPVGEAESNGEPASNGGPEQPEPSPSESDDLEIQPESVQSSAKKPSQAKASQTQTKEATPTSSPVIEIDRPRGRSAKAKASAKLHQDMDDLNKYMEMKKSSRKMDDFMKTLGAPEQATPAKRKATPEVDTPKKSAKMAIKYTVLLTGCESDINLTKSDTTKLRASGIRVANDSGTNINVLVAPKILRTEKFLTSLATVSQIVHPQYLVDVLAGKEPNIEEYSLDKFEELQALNQELGYASQTADSFTRLVDSPKKGSLFENLSINLSSNLNGGYSTLSKILSHHGVSQLTGVTFKSSLNLKHLVQHDGAYVLVVHKTKDTKLISYVKKNFPDITMVEWDWCVRSMFKMEVEPYTEYLV